MAEGVWVGKATVESFPVLVAFPLLLKEISAGIGAPLYRWNVTPSSVPAAPPLNEKVF